MTSQTNLSEAEICIKIMNWLKEGERHFDLYPNVNPPDKKHPSTLHGYVQVIGWVKRDLRVALDKARERIKELEKELGHG